MRIHHLIASLILPMGFLLGQSVQASEHDEWNFEVTPYMFASGINGEAGIRGVTADVDMSFSEIMDQLDSAFMGMLTAQKGRWTFAVDGIYSKLSGEESESVTCPITNCPAGPVNVKGALELTNEMSIYQGSVGYRMLDDNTKLDVLAGLRYTKLEVDVDVQITAAFAGGSPFLSAARSAGGSESWTDAVIGARVIHPVSENVDLMGYVDVGSDTHQLMAGVNWEFKKDYTAKFGYRALDWDYKDGGFKWDMTMDGLYAGIGIRF